MVVIVDLLLNSI